jgi:hypothetical protein
MNKKVAYAKNPLLGQCGQPHLEARQLQVLAPEKTYQQQDGQE